MHLRGVLGAVPAAASDAPAVAAAIHPSSWTAFATSNVTPDRLNAVLADLFSQRDRAPVFLARSAHVLMMLGRAGEAAALLEGLSDRLCRAQRLLALTQQARDEQRPQLYAQVAAHPGHFGAADTLLDLEAQMRLDYAMSIAHMELNTGEARTYGDRATHTALMIGMPQMEGMITRLIARRDGLRSPALEARRMATLGAETAESGNHMLATHLAHCSVDLLLRWGLYEEIAGLEEIWALYVPDGRTWAAAGRTLLDPVRRPPPVSSWTPVTQLAYAAHAVENAARAWARADRPDMLAHSLSALQLPGWTGKGAVSTAEVIYRCLRVFAHLYHEERREATIALRDVVHERLHDADESARLMVAVTALSVCAHGAAGVPVYPPDRAMRDALQALDALPQAAATRVLKPLAMWAPAAIVALSIQPSAHAVVCAAASHIARLNEDGVMLGGVPVQRTPRDGAMIDALLDGAYVAEERMGAHRYRKAMAALPDGPPPVASEWRVRRILASLLPVESSRGWGVPDADSHLGES